MALDEPRDSDKSFDVNGFTYVVNDELLGKASPIKVDFVNYGFRLDCAIDFSAGKASSCGGCGSSSNCC
ncbi:MAG: hypothetical protein ABIL58_02310 [Pseudomonadota bacterium]